MMKVYMTLLMSCAVAMACAQMTPQERLENSPRHHEWQDIKYGDRTVRTFVVFPEVADAAPAVLVIHENRGLNDWARGFADQVAEAGYIAVAPDLLSGTGPDGGGTSAFASSDDARNGIYELDPEQVTADLRAVADYAKQIDAANGQLVVIGFCWGGSQAFRFATNSDQMEAAFVCYGTAPKDEEALARISVPVYGFYGGNDNRVNATIADTESAMEKLGKVYEPVIYDGAGHGFFRAGESADASDDNKKARQDGWTRLKSLLEGLE